MKALITGISGQDGSYLAELLLSKGYEVHGIIRRNSSQEVPKNLRGFFDKITSHYSDLTDHVSISKLIQGILPDEIYNLAAQSHVGISFDMPVYSSNVNAFGPVNILESIRTLKQSNPKHDLKFYQASTSEMFGAVAESPQDENTHFRPKSPYAIAKLFAHNNTLYYRDAYDIFACCGILFNHESPRRGDDFVTQKIVKGIKNIVAGAEDHLELGNLNSLRDWGHAKDYVDAMWLMMHHNQPDSYVISTGIQHTVRYFVDRVCEYHNIKLDWVGEGIDECGYDVKTCKKIVSVNPKFFRPADVTTLLGNSNKAKIELGWKPKYNLDQLILDMCENA
jgi:GDPmannose 4,6-dehydratase